MLTIDFVDENKAHFVEMQQPEPKSGQVLLKVLAAGVNRADILQKQGRYPAPKDDSPILGLEVCAEVVALGSGVSHNLLGQRVMALCAGGGYGQFVCVDARHCLHVPAHFSHEQGAGFCETYLTAFDAISQHPDFGAGSTLLVHAGASGVGSAAIALAKAMKATVIVTVGSEQKRQHCLEWGADVAINYKEQPWDEVMRAQSLSADMIVDPIAGSYLNQDLKVLALDGRIVVLALLGGRFSEDFDGARLLQKRGHLIGSTLRNRSDDYKAALFEQFSMRFNQALEEGKLPVRLDSTFAWRDVEKAHKVLETNANSGKVVLYHP